MHVIKTHEQFGIPVTIPISGEDNTKRNSKFRIFLAEEGFKYSIKAHYEHVYYIVICDDFIDAAKVQTYLDTEPWTKQ